MRKHEVALNNSGITFAGITTILAVDGAFVLGSVTVAQSHLQYTPDNSNLQGTDENGSS